jgi:hypothetical protein
VRGGCCTAASLDGRVILPPRLRERSGDGIDVAGVAVGSLSQPSAKGQRWTIESIRTRVI